VNALTLAATSLRRYLRDRTALFFIVVLPILVVVIVGTTVRGFDEFSVGVVVAGDGPRTDELVRALDEANAIAVTRLSSVDKAATAVRRAELSAAVVIPASYDDDLAANRDVAVGLVGDPTSTTFLAAQTAVASVVAQQGGTIQAARFVTEQVGGDLDDNAALADRTAGSIEPVAVRATSIDAASSSLPEGFSYSAPTMLVLFVFINSLAGGAAIIENRRLRMYERVSAAPVTRLEIIAGETLAYLGIALLQSAIIVGVGGVLFGVDWGDPIAAAALVFVWALVGTGAGVLSGTLFRTPEQASSIGPPLGIAAGMLGGCMWPLEIVPAFMRTVGHALPHAWAVDAWGELLSRGGGIGDIAQELVVLGAFAAALLVISTTRLRHHLVL
jgi:ABC-2 type transport system permease protein